MLTLLAFGSFEGPLVELLAIVEDCKVLPEIWLEASEHAALVERLARLEVGMRARTLCGEQVEFPLLDLLLNLVEVGPTRLVYLLDELVVRSVGALDDHLLLFVVQQDLPQVHRALRRCGPRLHSEVAANEPGSLCCGFVVAALAAIIIQRI